MKARMKRMSPKGDSSIFPEVEPADPQDSKGSALDK